MGAIILTTLATGLLLVFFTGCGLAAWLNTNMAKTHPGPAYGLGVSFFFGMAAFLALFRGVGLLLGSARLSFLLTLVAMGAAAAALLWRLAAKKRLGGVKRWFITGFTWKGLLFFALLVIFVAYTGMVLPRQIFREDLTAFSSIGTLHSPRYALIAQDIVAQNRIPVIGQNYGQSILVAAVQFIYPGGEYYVLYLLAMLSRTMLLVFTYGLCRDFLRLSPFWATLSTLLAVCGGTALSLGNVLMVDSGYPMFTNTYTDSQFSVGSFYVAVAALITIWQSRKDYAFAAALLVAFGVSWNFTAAQNNLFLLMLMGAAFLVAKGFRKQLFALGATLAAATLAGVPMGGMLTPKTWVNAELPGQMQVKNTGVVLHEFSFPAFFATDKGNQGLVYYLEPVAYSPILKAVYGQLAVIVAFFPLAAAALFLGLWYRKCLTEKNQLVFGAVSLFSFGAALVLVCFVSVGSVDYWWEMSRFIMKDYYAMLLLLGVCLAAFRKRYGDSMAGAALAQKRGRKARLPWPTLIALAVTAFSLFGPMYGVLFGRGLWKLEGPLVYLDSVRRLYEFWF